MNFSYVYSKLPTIPKAFADAYLNDGGQSITVSTYATGQNSTSQGMGRVRIKAIRDLHVALVPEILARDCRGCSGDSILTGSMNGPQRLKMEREAQTGTRQRSTTTFKYSCGCTAPDMPGVKRNDLADRLAGKATATSAFRLGRSEVLKKLAKVAEGTKPRT